MVASSAWIELPSKRSIGDILRESDYRQGTNSPKLKQTANLLRLLRDTWIWNEEKASVKKLENKEDEWSHAHTKKMQGILNELLQADVGFGSAMTPGKILRP